MLADARVRFVLIGGHAVAAHGFERATRDVDIVFSTERESCSDLAAFLQKSKAVIVVADELPPDERISGEWLENGGRFLFRTAFGQLDALSWVSGFDYQTLEAKAETAELADGTCIRVCSYEHLVAMKQATGRARDQLDIDELEALRRDD